jgi:hypothetical protein
MALVDVLELRLVDLRETQAELDETRRVSPSLSSSAP